MKIIKYASNYIQQIIRSKCNYIYRKFIAICTIIHTNNYITDNEIQSPVEFLKKKTLTHKKQPHTFLNMNLHTTKKKQC